jgi:signal transduction histidine kinase
VTLPLALYSFAALLFTALTVSYWSERRVRRTKSAVLPVFTLVCAAAFVDSVLLQVGWFSLPLVVVREMVTGLMPPLILHLVLEPAWGRLRAWRGCVWAFYAAAVVFAIGRIWFPGEFLYRTPALMLAITGTVGLAAWAHSKAPIRGVLILMTACAAASLAGWGALVGQAPDYLVLAFFAITLYDRERLVFFDVLVKSGAFLALGMAAMALYSATAPGPVGLLAFWVGGAWLYPKVARAIDSLWLKRRYSAADAERQFIHSIQGAADEEELAARAVASLGAIFQAPAEVRFQSGGAAAVEDGLAAELEAGGIALAPRPDGIPFLSDDRRLLGSLAGALNVVLLNVRFREREQQLRLLATRAELKALRAQINPHFLFNSLSVIAGLIQYQPELADETIEQLAQVFRYTLRKSENEWSPLSEEVEFVTAYLRIEQARFGERLRTEFSVDSGAAAVAVPAMCVQPLIENAIKHGVSTVAGPGRVGLRATVVDGELRIEVEDSGPGFPPRFSLDGHGEGHGLRNVAERLRGYYGAAARLSWDSGPQGTRVTIALPVSGVRSACA